MANDVVMVIQQGWSANCFYLLQLESAKGKSGEEKKSLRTE